MTDEEIEVVAAALAQAGGSSWYPGGTDDPVLRVVSNQYRSRARLATAALERFQAGTGLSRAHGPPTPYAPASDTGPELQPGTTVIYRPPGERRAYPCRIVEICGNQAYLEPILRACTGWVSIESLHPLPVEAVSNDQ